MRLKGIIYTLNLIVGYANILTGILVICSESSKLLKDKRKSI